MLNFKLVNNVLGWLSFAISLLVYTLTIEPSVPLWDCGEFISAAYKLQVVHPPGAPLFLMLGRVFSLFAGSPENVAFAVNFLSAVAAALTVMFTFWIITHFGKKLMGIKLSEKQLTLPQGIALFSAGLVGSLALTFMDTFWFSAVEAEVYASSSLFTAITFWLILKWEANKDQIFADRWLILIFFLIGLAIGLHLLNLLVIPAVIYYYYFNKYDYSRKGLSKASAIGLGILGFLQWGLIPGLPRLASSFDLFFVNELGLPFNIGVIIFIAVLFGLLAFGLFWTTKNGHALYNLILLCVTFLVIGYSCYAMVPIRSLAEPTIDMNNPEDAHSLLSYINREQYGDRPLFKGPYFTARPIGINEGRMQYRKDKEDGKYEKIGEKFSYEYDEKDETIFPRMGDAREKNQGFPIWISSLEGKKRNPTFSENIGFFFKYQIGWMYARYFFWNFIGRQSDVQNVTGEPFDGNWLSGIGFLDARLGPQKNIPPLHSSNKGRNTYFFLPLILGLIGVLHQFKKQKLDAWVVTCLFVFTGLAIIVFLNQPPLEPRERDYAFVGSFQTFCIWIGLGVLYVYDQLSKRLNGLTAAGLSGILCLFAVPVLMGAQNWDDHDRSGRDLALAFAKNYLNSCDENAILFTNGDNDTYPLWYAQNVEGYRTDVRIINLSLLSTEWYSSALRRKFYKSEALPISIPAGQMEEGKREYLRYNNNPKIFPEGKYYEVDKIVKFITSDDRRFMVNQGNGEFDNYLPTRNLILPIDKQVVIESGTVKAKDSSFIVPAMMWKHNNGRGIMKGSYLVYDIIATNAKNGWERPIYFTTTTSKKTYLGLDKYMRLEGLTYRLVPIESNLNQVGGMIDLDLLYDKLMNTFVWGGMEKGDEILLDDKATLVPKNLRNTFTSLSRRYAAQGDNEKATKLLDHCMTVIPASSLPMEPNMKWYFIDCYYLAKSADQGERMLTNYLSEVQDLLNYYAKFKGKLRDAGRRQKIQTISSLLQAARTADREKLKEFDQIKSLLNSKSNRFELDQILQYQLGYNNENVRKAFLDRLGAQ